MNSPRAYLLAVSLVTVLGCGEPLAPDDSTTAAGAMAGENMGGVNLSGANLGGFNLAGVNLGGVNLSGANLGGVNLGGANLGASNLSGANLSGSNLSAANLSGANLSGGNLSGANLSGSNLSGSNLSAGNLSAANLSGSNLSGSNLAFASAVTGANIHNLASMTGAMLASGEDLFHVSRRGVPSTDTSCIVLGIGSPAFARLINQNPTNFFNARIKQLPWNLTAGGQTLNAWEVLVWGSSKYASFIVLAPLDTTYEGVRGFVKAVFRWNAKPTQAIEIGQIGGGQPLVQYTGMMGAAAVWGAGTITDFVYISGFVTLAEATTNNISVQVDFSSYVRTKSGTFLVLGNPSPNPDGGAQYDEATFVYYPVQSGDVTQVIQSGGAYYSQVLNDWNNSGHTKVPKRCAGAKYLAAQDAGYTIPPGKCDTYVNPTYGAGIGMFASGAWNTLPATSAGYTFPVPLSYTTYYPSITGTVSWTGYVAGTHTILNEPPSQ